MDNDAKQRLGLVHIYYGGGKGKTTAAVGQAVRAAGYGYRVLFFQFLKDNRSSERKILSGLPQVDCIDGPDEVCFTFQMTEAEKEKRRQFYQEKMEDIQDRLQSGRYDMAVLDESIYAVKKGLLAEEQLLHFLGLRPKHVEVVLTGNVPGQKLLTAADYVTEMKLEKHPFSRGIKARDGIER